MKNITFVLNFTSEELWCKVVYNRLFCKVSGYIQRNTHISVSVSLKFDC